LRKNYLFTNPIGDKQTMKRKSKYIILIGVAAFIYLIIWSFKNFNFNSDYEIGDKLDSLNGVYVYYNGGVDNVTERNTSEDGYNIGLKYQCVEFVKRYYFEHLNHKMADSYGHAKSFFNSKFADAEVNTQRNLIQYKNPSAAKPQVKDLIVFDGTVFNRFGHVAIISDVSDSEIEIIQQNPGPFAPSRETFALDSSDDKWKIQDEDVLGWLRKVDKIEK
jgi:surface antigen